MASITARPDYHPEDAITDANALREAMKGLGTDEAAIIRVLTTRSLPQRQMIVKAYATAIRRDLLKDLKDELSGDLEKGVLALVKDPAVRDAEYLNQAMAGLGTDEHLLREILCSRTGPEIRAIAAAYQQLYKKDLKAEVASETSGDFKEVLVALASGAREDGPADSARVLADVDALYKAGAGKWGTNEGVFINLLTTRSHEHLRAVFATYADVYHTDIAEALRSEMSGELLKSLQLLVTFVRAPEEYFADELNRAMAGIGTNEDALTRVIVTRADIDLQKIKLTYKFKYGKPLDQVVASEVGGDYKKLLIAAMQ